MNNYEVMEQKPQSCVICFQSSNNNSDITNFIELSATDEASKTYLDKIRYLTNFEIVIYNCSLICLSCTKELDDACKFREKVIQSLEYWSNNFQNNLKNEDLDDIETKTEFSELSFLDRITEELQIENLVREEILDENPKVFSCDKCKQSFTSASDSLLHNCDCVDKKKENKFNVTNGKENLAFQCKICDMSFDKNWKLNRHTKIFHLNVKNYVCNYCHRGFKQLYHLQEHITSHTGERKFKCNICNKTFSRMSSQRKHMKAHEAAPGEKTKKSPFLCSICGKKFPYSNGAQRHMRTHSDDRRYDCKICGNKFSQKTHLRVHLRTHTGEKPYPCKLCAESFSLNANLRKHMKNHKNPENVKIFHNLEPNLSETKREFDFEETQSSSQEDYIEREVSFSFVEGF